MQSLSIFLKKHAVFFVAALYISLFFLRYTNFTASDLGRHLKNGQIILESGRVFDTNYYSYTHPNFVAPNHHWLFGVLADVAETRLGFAGLTILNACIVSLAFLLMVLVAAQKSSKMSALVAAFIALPLVTSRTEVRPETFSLLFMASFYTLLYLYEQRRITFKLLLGVLVAVQILWTNIHLFFIFGPALVGYYWLRTLRKDVFVCLVVVSMVTLINPNGWRSAIAPFNIFNEYGYMVAENQSAWFMIRRLQAPIYYYIALVFGLGLIALVQTFSTVKARSHQWFAAHRPFLTDVALYVTFGIAALAVVRVSTFFGLLIIPLLAGTSNHYSKQAQKLYKRVQSSTTLTSLSSLIGFGLIIVIGTSGLFIPDFRLFGIGLAPRVEASARFFKDQAVVGPIFNNYDIGGYLIYHLFPTEQVFVDNRPEAYPVRFFDEDYIQPQELETAWQSLDSKFSFNVIYFYRHDATPWAQPFLIKRLQDPSWVAVFVDDYAIILVRNSLQNKNVIEKYAVPKERFNITK